MEMEMDKNKDKKEKKDFISPYSFLILFIVIILFFLIYKITQNRKTVETTFHVESPTFS